MTHIGMDEERLIVDTASLGLILQYLIVAICFWKVVHNNCVKKNFSQRFQFALAIAISFTSIAILHGGMVIAAGEQEVSLYYRVLFRSYWALIPVALNTIAGTILLFIALKNRTKIWVISTIIAYGVAATLALLVHQRYFSL